MTVRELKREAKFLEAEYYYILTGFDERTCEKCLNLERRVFHISEAVGRKTLPPFCSDCRCACCIESIETDYKKLQNEKNLEFVKDILEILDSGSNIEFALLCYQALLNRLSEFDIIYNAMSSSQLSRQIQNSIDEKFRDTLTREYSRALGYARELKTFGGRRKRLEQFFFAPYCQKLKHLPTSVISIIEQYKKQSENDLKRGI